MHWLVLFSIFLLSPVSIRSSTETLSMDVLPPKCRALPNYGVDCSSSGFTELPKFSLTVSKDIKRLLLNNNSINVLRIEIAGQRFSSMTFLDISSSGVQEVDSFAGYSFPKLEHLRINKNRISHISWISSFQKLKILDIRESVIESLSSSSGGESRLMLTHLESLDLSKNKIVDCSPISNGAMSSLRRLNLSSNKLANLNGVAFPKKLLQLDLSSNSLSALPPEFLNAMPRLQWLRLSQNKITSLSFLISNNSHSLWKVDLANNQLTCTCKLYRQKVALGRQGLVFGDSPFCTDETFTNRRTSLFSFDDSVCPQIGSNICQQKNDFHYFVKGTKLSWDVHDQLKGTNVSWVVSDESGAELNTAAAPIELREGELTAASSGKMAQVCVHLSRASVTCLHSCRLISGMLLMSTTGQLLVAVIAVTGGIALILIIAFIIRERERCCGSPAPTIQYSASMHSISPSMHGSRTDMLVETTNLDELSLRRPTSSFVSNGNQTVPGRHFVRKQPLAGGPMSMHVRRTSLFRSERALNSVPNNLLHSMPNVLASSRQSLASRALPEVPSGSYCEMANVAGPGTYEFMDNNRAPDGRSSEPPAVGDTYQELGYN